MAASPQHRPTAERTRALLARIAGGEHGARLRSQVAAWNPSATREQVEEAFQEACARADRQCTGRSEGEVFVWLRTTTHRELGRMRRRARREVLVEVSDPALASVDGAARAAVDELIAREDEAEVERVARAVLESLSERQRAIAALHSHGLRRPQIAEHLGVTPRVVKRSLEQIMAAGRDQLVRLAGHGCDGGERLIARFAFGLASSREARQAQLHLATCQRCGAMYERLDLWREKVAALLPVPAAGEAHAHVVERVVHAGNEVFLGSGSQHAGSGLRRHVADAVAHMREHAGAAYYRAVDPTPLAGVRPGAVAAAVAGCLAVGGGATYCVQRGVGPIAGIRASAAPTHHDARPKHRHRPKRARAAQVAPPPAAAVPPVTTAPAPAPAAQQSPPQQAPATTTTQAPPPPAPQEEYEPGSAATGSGTSVQAASPTASQPAPAPTGGAGEFGGP